jgi:hypothetical protein
VRTTAFMSEKVGPGGQAATQGGRPNATVAHIRVSPSWGDVVVARPRERSSGNRAFLLLEPNLRWRVVGYDDEK